MQLREYCTDNDKVVEHSVLPVCLYATAATNQVPPSAAAEEGWICCDRTAFTECTIVHSQVLIDDGSTITLPHHTVTGVVRRQMLICGG